MRSLYFCVVATSLYITVSGHGRLMSPPSRASMWRVGFDTPKDYSDNQGFCGGYAVQWEINGGKCGLCGDDYRLPTPRPHEAGGKYGNGIIVETYEAKETVVAAVDITANHWGYLTFRLCPAVSPTQDPTQECFDANPIPIDKEGNIDYYLNSSLTGVYLPVLHLPDIECEHCVLQWTYTTGNSWGQCENGETAVGCGPQEHFRACADIRIRRSQSETTEAQTTTEEVTEAQTTTEEVTEAQTTTEGVTEAQTTTEEVTEAQTTTEEVTEAQTTTEEVTEAQTTTEESVTTSVGWLECHAVGQLAHVGGMDEWCTRNCNANPPFCPSSVCQC